MQLKQKVRVLKDPGEVFVSLASKVEAGFEIGEANLPVIRANSCLYPQVCDEIYSRQQGFDFAPISSSLELMTKRDLDSFWVPRNCQEYLTRNEFDNWLRVKLKHHSLVAVRLANQTLRTDLPLGASRDYLQVADGFLPSAMRFAGYFDELKVDGGKYAALAANHDFVKPKLAILERFTKPFEKIPGQDLSTIYEYLAVFGNSAE